MSITPMFQSPAPSGQPVSPLIEIDKALESMRDSGFDITAAVGEPIDNSIEAGASVIRIQPVFSRDRKHITTVAIADNGSGIPDAVLPAVLRLGFSTRYNERKGLGRFGVGLTLAGLSLGTRMDVLTRTSADKDVRRTYLDLKLISERKQSHMDVDRSPDWPADFREMMVDRDGTPFGSGTLVLFGNVDRLSSGGSYGTSLEAKLDELRKFIARAYRIYLEKGLVIELDGKPVTLHDPLFLRPNPRITKRYPRHVETQGRVIDEETLTIDGHDVHVTVALAPEIFRPFEGSGGEVDFEGKSIREFQITRENAGRVSILRNGREIYYDLVPRLLPGGVDKVDRYIGIEVSFPAELDEYFQVRHVKRGAEPVDKLRVQLREWLVRPVRMARSEIRSHWRDVSVREHQDKPAHTSVLEAVDRAEREAPKGQAGLGITDEQAQQVIDDLLEDLQLDPKAEPEKADAVRKQIDQHAITMVDGSWPGRELFEISHLNGKAILKLNHRHPFMREIYAPIKEVADAGTDDMTATDIVELARKVETAIDVLFLGYAKAENMHKDPGMFDDLRTWWGQHTAAYMKELGGNQE